jgi:hypothetical protein
MAEYFASDGEHPISEETLRDSGREIQRNVMETWFRQHFEDPAERTPYDSSEGGYIWIWGGPYDAREELEDEFSGIVPEEIIEELARELDSENQEWAPTPSPYDYDQYVEDIGSITEYYNNFSGAILDIERLLKSKVEDSVSRRFLRLLYVNVVTALETYLSDAFISTVVNALLLMRRFIETTPEFKAEKVSLADVFKAAEGVERTARAYLIDVVWHHIERVRPMYHATLNVDFPDDLSAIYRAVLTRHDIVHRNGKTKDGNEIIVTPKDISKLIEAVKAFVEHIEGQLAKVRSNP